MSTNYLVLGCPSRQIEKRVLKKRKCHSLPKKIFIIYFLLCVFAEYWNIKASVTFFNFSSSSLKAWKKGDFSMLQTAWKKGSKRLWCGIQNVEPYSGFLSTNQTIFRLCWQFDADPCLFNSPTVICLIYVDDALFVYKSLEEVDILTKKVKDLGMLFDRIWCSWLYGSPNWSRSR